MCARTNAAPCRPAATALTDRPGPRGHHAGMSAPPVTANRKVKPLRNALYAALITFATSVIGLSIIYFQARDALMSGVQSELLNLARTTAAQVDGDLHRTLVSP